MRLSSPSGSPQRLRRSTHAFGCRRRPPHYEHEQAGRLMPGQVIIKAEGLRKVYGGTVALSDLTFEVPEGEVFGFIGANGAGKTTTLRILAGLARPSAGWAEVDGVDVATGSGPAARAGRVHARLLRRVRLHDGGRVPGLLCLVLPAPQAPDVTRVVTDLLELVHLGSKQDAQVNTLSRGMKQRLCLARALVHDPKVLLLDEPASGLDPRARGEMRELVQALREMGKTIVLSSHILPELAEMCTSYGIIHDGRMVATARPAPSWATRPPAGPGTGAGGPRGGRAAGREHRRRLERAAGRGGHARDRARRQAGRDGDRRRRRCSGPWSPRASRWRLQGGRWWAGAAVPAVDGPNRGRSPWSRPDDSSPVEGARTRAWPRGPALFLPPSPGTRSSAKSSAPACGAGTRSHCSPGTCASSAGWAGSSTTSTSARPATSSGWAAPERRFSGRWPA